MDEHRAVESDGRSHQAENFTAIPSVKELLETTPHVEKLAHSKLLFTAILSQAQLIETKPQVDERTQGCRIRPRSTSRDTRFTATVSLEQLMGTMPHEETVVGGARVANTL